MSKLVRYRLAGASYEHMKVADKGDYVLFADAEQRIEELTGSLEEIKHIASAFPQDKAILKVAGKALGVS